MAKPRIVPISTGNLSRPTESTMIPYSLLDLAPVTEGSTPREAFANTLDLARHAEALGYHRYWLAEHHNMPGIASARSEEHTSELQSLMRNSYAVFSFKK